MHKIETVLYTTFANILFTFHMARLFIVFIRPLHFCFHCCSSSWLSFSTLLIIQKHESRPQLAGLLGIQNNFHLLKEFNMNLPRTFSIILWCMIHTFQ